MGSDETSVTVIQVPVSKFRRGIPQPMVRALLTHSGDIILSTCCIAAVIRCAGATSSSCCVKLSDLSLEVMCRRPFLWLSCNVVRTF